MDKELVKKLIKGIIIFVVAIVATISILVIISQLTNKDEKVEKSRAVNEFKSDYRKIFEGELFKIYVYKDGHAQILAGDKLKEELNMKNSKYITKFESNAKKEALLKDGIKVEFNNKKDKVYNAFEYIVGENGEQKGIAFTLSSGEGALLLEDDIFKGDKFIPKKIKGLKKVEYFTNLKNVNKVEGSSLNKGYNIVAVVKNNNMWNVVTDKNSVEENMYVNNTTAKLPVMSFEDTYYVELPDNLYVNKGGYAYFSKRPQSFKLREEFTGFNSIDENIIENVFIGAMDDSQFSTYFKDNSLIGGFCYMFVAKNGNMYLLPTTVIENGDGEMFVAKTVNEVTNVKNVELYQFLEDNKKDGIAKDSLCTVITYKDTRKQILKEDNYLKD